MRFGVDGWKVVQFVVWTCITVPLNFRWQAWLERRWPAFYPEWEGEGEKEGRGVELGRGGGGGRLPVVEVGVVSSSLCLRLARER